GCRRCVFLLVRALDRLANAFAADAHRADVHLPIAHLDGPKRIVEERPIPSVRRLLPRAREYPADDDNRPDADEAMVRSGAGADAKNLARVDGGDDGAG